jgi:hypothetical protein
VTVKVLIFTAVMYAALLWIWACSAVGDLLPSYASLLCFLYALVGCLLLGFGIGIGLMGLERFRRRASTSIGDLADDAIEELIEESRRCDGSRSRSFVVGFDVRMFEGAGISVGPESQSPDSDRVILRAMDGQEIAIDRGGIEASGRRLRGSEAVRFLEEHFPTPRAYSLLTRGGSLQVDADGGVEICGEGVGTSDTLLAGLLAHLALTALPHGRQWIPEVMGDLISEAPR